MILKLTASVKKEFLLLIRDRAGLAMLFIMPVALVLIMNLLQDSSFRMLEEKNYRLSFSITIMMFLEMTLLKV